MADVPEQRGMGSHELPRSVLYRLARERMLTSKLLGGRDPGPGYQQPNTRSKARRERDRAVAERSLFGQNPSSPKRRAALRAKDIVLRISQEIGEDPNRMGGGFGLVPNADTTLNAADELLERYYERQMAAWQRAEQTFKRLADDKHVMGAELGILKSELAKEMGIAAPHVRTSELKGIAPNLREGLVSRIRHSLDVGDYPDPVKKRMGAMLERGGIDKQPVGVVTKVHIGGLVEKAAGSRGRRSESRDWFAEAKQIADEARGTSFAATQRPPSKGWSYEREYRQGSYSPLADSLESRTSRDDYRDALEAEARHREKIPERDLKPRGGQDKTPTEEPQMLTDDPLEEEIPPARKPRPVPLIDKRIRSQTTEESLKRMARRRDPEALAGMMRMMMARNSLAGEKNLIQEMIRKNVVEPGKIRQREEQLSLLRYLSGRGTEEAAEELGMLAALPRAKLRSRVAQAYGGGDPGILGHMAKRKNLPQDAKTLKRVLQLARILV